MICNIKYVHYIKENEKKFIETLTGLIEEIDYVSFEIIHNDCGLKLNFNIITSDLFQILRNKKFTFKSENIELEVDVGNDLFHFKSSVDGGKYGCYSSDSTYYPKFDIKTTGGKVIYDSIYSKLNEEFPIDKLIENEIEKEKEFNKLTRGRYKPKKYRV